MKKIIKGIVILFLICVILVVSINLYVCLSIDKSIITEAEVVADDYDAIIVLGCGVTPDGVPTRMLKDRLDTAIRLYKDGKCDTILMSGDHGTDGYDEVNCMFNYAIEHGVASEDVFLDHAGFSTYETMIRASKIFGIKKAIIVTQEYHLYRAVYNANSMGIEAVGVKAESDPFVEQPYYSLREYGARVKDFFFDLFKPNPTYLGDSIDIHGDSSVTFDE
ncbi:MAG: YdcF family protein [Clostridia bacterium]|nr:YdcF family protein [Clostridia bacterium]